MVSSGNKLVWVPFMPSGVIGALAAENLFHHCDLLKLGRADIFPSGFIM